MFKFFCRINLLLMLFFCAYQFQSDVIYASDIALPIHKSNPDRSVIGIAVIDDLSAKILSLEDVQLLRALLKKYPTSMVTKNTMSIADAAGPFPGMIYLQDDDNPYTLKYVVNSDCSIIYFHNEETDSAWLDRGEIGRFRVINVADDDRETLASLFFGNGSAMFYENYLKNFAISMTNKYSNVSDPYVEKFGEAEMILVAGRIGFKIISRNDIAYIYALITNYKISDISFGDCDFSHDKFKFKHFPGNALTLFFAVDTDLFFPFATINPITGNFLWVTKYGELSERFHEANDRNYKVTVGISRDDKNKLMSILRLSPTLGEVFGE